MFRGIITAIVAGAIVTGLASTAYAKPRGQSQSEGGYTTRSGESLRGLESRSGLQDLATSSSESSPSSVPAPILLHDISQPVTQPQSVTIFGEKIELGHRGSSQNSGNQAPSHANLRNVEVSAGASSTDPEQVLRVQYQLMSNPDQK